MKQRDLLLVPFPFSDQTGQKVRPVLVLSSDAYNQASEDLVVCALTRQPKHNRWSIPIDERDLEHGVLYERSTIKVEGLLRISRALIIKKFGRLRAETFEKARRALFELFE